MLLPNAQSGESDWPQWRGPKRDGHSPARHLMKSWPEGGPQVRWSFTGAGIGYSAVSVVDERLYTLGAIEDRCFAICVSLKDGSLIWKSDFCRASNSDDYNTGWGAGPRSTPTVDGNQVFVLSDIGVLACLDKSSGKIQWKTNLVEDHGGNIPTWGYSDSPLIDGTRVVVTPGASKFLLAVDRYNGSEVWKSQGVDASAQYVSIMKGKVDQTTFYLSASKAGMVAFDTRTGTELFADTASGNRTAVIPTPILHRNQIYHTSAFGAGSTLLNVSRAGQGGLKAESAYHLRGKTMENDHGGVVLLQGTIFGFSRANGGVWMAQDLETGMTLWEEKIRPNKSGSICYADGRLYCYNDNDGTVFLVEPSRSGWLKKGSLKIPQQTDVPRDRGAIWTHPVVASQTLIIRDQDLIYAFDVSEE